jgi:acetoin utilization deacetylase AcuC-like enzyme
VPDCNRLGTDSLHMRLPSTGLCEQLPARSASQAELLAVHSSGLLGSLAQLSEDSPEHLTSLIGTHLAGDAFGNRHTYAAGEWAAVLTEGCSTLGTLARWLERGCVSAPAWPRFCMSRRSAATLAAGTAAEMAIRLAKREAASGFAVVRPPGHLASSSHAEAGNYVNSVAVAAKAAQRTGGASRVLIVDWDCHHGK